MTDIVERLEGYKREAYPSDMELHETAGRAKDEIERLRADNERLRAALTRLVAWEGPVELACPELGGLLKAMYDARAALKEGKDD